MNREQLLQSGETLISLFGGVGVMAGTVGTWMGKLFVEYGKELIDSERVFVANIIPLISGG